MGPTMMYDHINSLLTHYSNQLLTHSLTIPAKLEIFRRSLWGLIKNNWDNIKLFWSLSDLLGPLQTILDHIEPSWTMLNHLGLC